IRREQRASSVLSDNHSLEFVHSPDSHQQRRKQNLGGTVQSRSHPQPQELDTPPTAEQLLSARDSILARVIASQSTYWPSQPTEDPIWGLIRIIIAQQISTGVAC